MTSTQRAEALFDFEATAEVELKMRKGDVVVVKRMSVGEGWWEGELNGKRGLFPSSFVKLLPVVHEPMEIPTSPPAPLTPHSTKKAFMETMLAPEPSTLDEIYDDERAREVFVTEHHVVSIEVGPRWKSRPPKLTVVVKEPQTEPRFSGMKHVTLYDVDTRELGSCVPRKYKQFLWLYDRLAENFPCISLPPLPVKQGSGQERGKEARRKGLEKFLRKVARHPVLGCTRFLKVFLTEDTKSDKEWKIGKHLSGHSHNIKLPKTPRKLFHAPVYCTVKYPPYNVPVSQLASIEKFSKFSRILESNVNTLHMACRGVTLSQRDMLSNVNLLAKDLKCFGKGLESTGGAHRRKLQAKVSVTGVSSVPLPPVSLQSSAHTMGGSSNELLGGPGSEGQEESSGGEDGDTTGPPQWNWRDDKRFNSMLSQLLELASGLQKMWRVFQSHQDSMETEVMETLQEYSGVINTLPGLVRLHEEAMEYYNSSKTKDSKTEAEEVRQNCETLNNILLSEFDYFSNHLVNDFPAMIQRLLLQQSNFHRKMAEEWSSLHARYSEQISSSDTPVQTSSSSTLPRPRTTSASQPHLHTLHPPPPAPTPSDLLTSSGGSYSQDDVVGYTTPHQHYPSQSQSHPNIHSLGLASKPPVHNKTATDDVDAKSGLTSSSDSHAETATPPTEVIAEPLRSPQSYVNFDIDELNETSVASRDQRLNRLSPLELSIEKELEKTHGMTPTSEEKPVGDLAELHPYANWQFEKMNEKAHKSPAAASTTRTKPLLNGVPTGRQESKSTAGICFSPPRKPLKPPSPFRLQNLSDLTSIDSSSSVTPSKSRETSSPQKMSQKKSSEEDESGGGGGKSSGKGHGTAKVYEDLGSRGGPARNIDQILPSQLNLGGKPRSYTTTTQLLAKKKPLVPPGGSGGGGGKRGSLKSRLGKRHHQTESSTHGATEMLEELEHSYEKEPSANPSSLSRGAFLSPGQESGKETAAATKPGSAPNELMRKLTLRRQRLEQQMMASGSKHTSGSSTTTGGGDSSSRTSTSSTQSELVCSYNMKRSQDDISSAGGGGQSSLADVELRPKDEGSLAKYGIMEEGGTFEI
jgi:hypothetical protein